MNLRRQTVWVLAALWGVSGVGLHASQQNEAKKAEKAGQAQETRPATDDPAYVIGADDVLIVSVWKEAELTHTVPVRPDGKISLPLLNDVQAAGYTPVQLGMLITERLRKFVSDPQVTVMVSTINSRRIYLVGEVGRAGAFPMLPNMTVLQALSSAGGFTQFADSKRIYVLRDENGVQKKYMFNYKEVIKGKKPEQNIVLKPGDTIVVP